MPKQQFVDAPGGDTVSYVTVTEDGYRLCPFFPQDDVVQANFDSVPGKKCRDDDILLCSYPKTGTNWLWEMVCMAIQRRRQVTSGTKGPGMLEAMPEDVQQSLESPRVLNSHLKFKYLPKEAREKKIKCVMICRNPKDTVVSFFHHTRGLIPYEYDGKFDNYVQMFMRGEVDYGSYAEYLLEWQQAIRDNPDWPIHVLYYEDLKRDCFAEMKRLVDYLGLNVEDELLREIIDSCQMSKIKQGKTEQLDPETLAGLKQVIKGDWTVYRKGIIGDWKNTFTESRAQEFDKWWADSTQGLDMFKFKYT